MRREPAMSIEQLCSKMGMSVLGFFLCMAIGMLVAKLILWLIR